MPNLLSLTLALIVLVLTARLAGALARLVGQPRVVGEMAAGIALGPSLLGWALPGVAAVLLPDALLPHLFTLSQVGLLIFMFLVGLEFDHTQLRRLGHTAVLASHASITIPSLLGVIAALYLYPRLSSSAVSFREFALFMAVAMSVTAFPVLARILRERRLQDTPLGTVAIACAAVDDVSAWCLLAGVIALVRMADGSLPVTMMLLGLLMYVGVMLLARRAVLGCLLSAFRRRGGLGEDVFAGVIIVVLLSALATEWLGLHLLFGAFFAGAVLPKDEAFVTALRDRLEMVATVLLLPIFFAYTGLRMEVGALQGAEMWFYFGLILSLAVAGKLGGSAIAARISGMPWREAAGLGILMNTRGLMELVVLNIGLDLGIISPALFSLMVLMALATTCMTTPLLQMVYQRGEAGPALAPGGLAPVRLNLARGDGA